MYLSSGGYREYIKGQILTPFWRFLAKSRISTQKCIFSLTFLPISVFEQFCRNGFVISNSISMLFSISARWKSRNLCSQITIVTIVGLVFLICYFLPAKTLREGNRALKHDIRLVHTSIYTQSRIGIQKYNFWLNSDGEK